ncbi:hypothetical protein KM043_008816 [Ampulex compressa]|nr:hypothetical protein KM043_008816 [Ampulex compressa]
MEGRWRDAANVGRNGSKSSVGVGKARIYGPGPLKVPTGRKVYPREHSGPREGYRGQRCVPSSPGYLRVSANFRFTKVRGKPVFALGPVTIVPEYPAIKEGRREG